MDPFVRSTSSDSAAFVKDVVEVDMDMVIVMILSIRQAVMSVMCVFFALLSLVASMFLAR
jgi:hypothetical protein